MTRKPTLKYLSTGYWHARWSSQVWAQWPVGSELTEGAFFIRSTATTERIEQCYEIIIKVEASQ